ncbi:MAG: carbon-nitrogen family hydrolase [Bacillota bacterium]
MRIAVIQMDILLGDTVKNLGKAVDLAKKAAQSNPDIIILPEMWNTSYDLKRVGEIADIEGTPSAAKMGALAGELGINLIAGSIADKKGEHVYNTSYVFNRKGEKVVQYSKIHLFGLMNEGDYLQRGDTRCIFQLDGVTCGLLICYDLRFPELSRALALDGAQIIFVPAQWPHPRMHPWRILNQARSIENQLFLVSANRTGTERGTHFFGHSMVVDPLGEVLFEGDDREQIAIIDINLDRVEEVRKSMTCFTDRVEEVYC